MTGTETDFAQQWGTWFRTRIRAKGWSVDDFVRESEARGYKVSRTQAYRWNRGEQPPSREKAAATADVLGVDRREAYLAAGHDVDPDTPIVTDPAEAFVQQIRARGLPPGVEKRFIARVRADIEQRRSQLEEDLDIVEAAIDIQPEPAEEL